MSPLDDDAARLPDEAVIPAAQAALEVERERRRTDTMKALSNRHLELAQGYEELLLRVFVVLAEMPSVSMALELSERLYVKTAAEAREALAARHASPAGPDDELVF